MSSVLTLIAAADGGLRPADLAIAADALRGLGCEPGAPDWLAAERACDIPLTGGRAEPDAAAATAALRGALAGAAVDAAVLPVAGRRKRLLVADMDSTIVTGETLDELADQAGLKAPIAAITARAMNGELDFKAALRERVALLEGLPAAALERTYERVRLTPGAATLVRTMRAGGAYTLLVSGGFRFFTARVRDLAGFHADRANELIVAGGALTGRVEEPILDRDAKLRALLETAAAHGLTPEDALAVGDGANDLAMLQAAGLGVAFRAKPIVAAQAQVRIDQPDLTALLYLQGYRREEFVE